MKGCRRKVSDIPMLDRLMERIEVDENGCWVWTGATRGIGYGAITKDGRLTPTHRLMYEEKFHTIPDGLLVLHRCDNPPCMNPEHLFLGTTRDNVADKMQKKREARGENHGMSRLKESDVIEIRRLHKYGVPDRLIARLFPVTTKSIFNITNGHTWVHLLEKDDC